MPRFYFNTHDGKYVPDEEGTELLNVRAARKEAARLAAGLMADNPDQAWEHDGWSVEVTNDRRLVLFKLMVLALNAPAGLDPKPVPSNEAEQRKG